MIHTLLVALPEISAFLVGYGLCYIIERLHNADAKEVTGEAPNATTDGRSAPARGTSNDRSEFSSLTDD